jgi:hypothetical protein
MLFVVAAACLAPAVLGRPAEEVYTSKAGGYSAKFPGTPKEGTRTQKASNGDVKVYYALFGTANGTAFFTSHNDYAGKASAEQRKVILDEIVKKATADGKPADVKDIEVGADKLPGRAYLVDKPKISVRGVVVMKDARVYQAIVTGPKDFVTGKEATAFLDSLQITK